MDFNSKNKLREAGFEGFKTFKEIEKLFNEIRFAKHPKDASYHDDSSYSLNNKGVYLVLNPDYEKEPEFRPIGTGGHPKGKDPNVTIDELKSNWVDNSLVVYIGKAGGDGEKATLQSRLKQYLRFGQEKKSPHGGGRFIWQLKNSADLIVCWKRLPNDDPRDVERQLIQDFKSVFSKRPFANLVD
jgi:hypothetical protein